MENWSLVSLSLRQQDREAEYRRNMRVKGGGSTVLWSRYFHHRLALQHKDGLIE